MKKKTVTVSGIDLKSCCVADRLRIIDALHAIESGRVGVCLAVDQVGKLVGTISDGDIRRALLSGRSLRDPLSPIIRRDFSSVRPGTGRGEVLELMRAIRVEQMPIVDKKGRPVGLHFLHDVLGGVTLPNEALILAGGLGTRLRPLTTNLPKPMMVVAGRPILERLLLHLVGYGIKKIHLAVRYLAHVIEDHFEDGSKFGCEISYVKERKPMGTGGALALLESVPTAPLIVMNGDLLTQVDIPRLLRFHNDGKFAATVTVRRYGHRVPFGCVDMLGDRVVALEEKPVLERNINAGIYVFEPKVINRLPKTGFPITEFISGLLKKKERIGAYHVEEEWLDVGQQEQIKPGLVL